MIHVEFWNISKYVSHQMSQNLLVMMRCTERRAPNHMVCQEILPLISINLKVLEL